MSWSDSQLNSIAIIGMAGRFPGADNLDAFWRNLRDGKESIRYFSDDELEKYEFDFKAVKHNPNYVRARGVLDGVDLFDAGFFGFNPREASILDPQHRIWLECAWEALENAGYDPEKYDGLIGLYAGGSFFDSYLLHNICRNREYLERLVRLRSPDAFSTLLGNKMEFMTTRTSHKLNLKGPSVNVQTGCSTSLVAVYHACQSLQNYDSDICLAGGVSVVFPQETGYLYQEGAITSPDGHCRPFDAKARGTVFSSGVGLVVLKRLEDAVEDSDHIIAVIRGIAANNDGSHKIGFTAPGVDGQAEVIAMAHAAAEVDPETISYVETHGTATPLGDPIEVAALTKAFRLKTDCRQFCGIGSVKSNIGHLDAAAGVAGLIKTALALQHKQIPPSLHYHAPNPEIDFETSPFYVVDRLTQWGREQGPRRAGVSAFGIGGTNAHAVLEEAPDLEPSGKSRPWQLIMLSAKTDTALDKRTDQLAHCLKMNDRINLSDVAYTLQVGRQEMNMRKVLVCRDREEALQTIEQPDSGGVMIRKTVKRDPPVVFMFSGQGSQYINMGRELYLCESAFKSAVDTCSEMLKPHLALDLRDIIFPDEENQGWATEQINQTGMTQPALFVIEYALAQLWMAWGIRPDAMIGHSLGEYVAASLAGVFSLEDALSVVATRARLMQAMPKGSMRAVRLSPDELKPYLGGGVALAAVNTPSLCVVSGSDESVDAFDSKLKRKNMETIRLHTSHAFHSEMMEPALAPFREKVGGVTLHPPEIPFISNVTGTWITREEATDPEYWAKQLRQPVNFSAGMVELQKEPGRVLIEVGPGTALSTSARQHKNRETDQTVISSLGHAKETQPALACMLKALGQVWLSGRKIDWERFYRHERRVRIPLPTYPFERKRYWIEPADMGVETVERADCREPSFPVLPEGELQAGVPGEAQTEPKRREAILTHLKNTIYDLSGIDFDEFDESTPFLEMGMDSLFLTQVSTRLKDEFGIEMGFRQLVQDFSTLNALAEHLDGNLPQEAFAIPAPAVESDRLSVCDQAGPGEAVNQSHRGNKPEIGVFPRFRNPPLSSTQQRLWYIDQLIPHSPVYNLPFAFRFSGALDPALLRRSLNELIRRHESLRTTFKIEEGVPVQVISPLLELDLPITDFSNFSRRERETKVAEYLKKEAVRPFNLSEGPLVRASLVFLSEQDHVFFFMPHHIIFDGISFVVFQRELFELYEAFKNNRPPQLEALPVQYADYSVWQQEQWLQGGEYKRQLVYWTKQLKGDLPRLQMPTDYPRPAVFSGRGATEMLTVPNGLMNSLNELGRKEGVTLFMVLLAAFKTLLHRYSGQDDICVGSPFSNRLHKETDGLIGFLTNTVVLRTEFDSGLSFRELLKLVKKVCLDAGSNQEMPFERLVQALNPERDLSVTPLYQVMFIFQGEMDCSMKMGDISWRVEEITTSVSQTDLMCSLRKTKGGLDVIFEYATDLFHADTIKRLINNYLVLLENIVVQPGTRLAELPLLTEHECEQLVLWNKTRSDYSREACIHELFEAQVEKDPAALAVTFEGTSLSYFELNERANKLASRLKRFGVGPDVLVGICIERSIEMLVGLLGILKAGGAYVPLDPEYPNERLAYMIENAQVAVLLTQQKLISELPDNTAQVLCIDTDPDKMSGRIEDRRVAWKNPGPTNLAYVIFTSGSTGNPKGVQVPHGAVVNFLTSMAQEPGMTRQDVMLAVTTLSFDIAVLELYLPLIVGARTVIVSRDVSVDGLQLLTTLETSKATVMQATPGTWRLLLAAGWGGADNLKVLCGGEAFPKDLAKELIGRVSSVWNMYGPTETTVWSTCCRLSGADGPIPVGRPIANTQTYVLDRYMQPVPVGVPGELYIGGDGVTRGYLTHPERTSENFVADPFCESSNGRLYRTGDLVKYRPDGNIEYLHRIDNQVKVRGFRIEPGEIETVLAEHEAVSQGIVTVREERAGDARLVAHIVYEPGHGATGSELRKHLRQKLPDYMIPQHFIEIDHLPLTPAGKIDRKKVQNLFTLGMVKNNDPVAPESENEKILAEIWQEELGLSQVSVHDNFFDIGGHSLLAIRVIARIMTATGVQLQPRDIFLNTLGQIAAQYQFAGSSPGEGKKGWLRELGHKIRTLLKIKLEKTEAAGDEN